MRYSMRGYLPEASVLEGDPEARLEGLVCPQDCVVSGRHLRGDILAVQGCDLDYEHLSFRH